MTKGTSRTAAKAYIEQYNRAMEALKAVEAFIHDNPAPDDEENPVHWGHVGTMGHIADELEEITASKSR